MAGHSQFKNIMYRKGAQDAKRAKIFTKLIRELTVSAKEGGQDIEANPRLRAAVIAARGANMPKDTIERAIKRASGGEDTHDYSEVRYEGYGPGGIALIIEVLTDNRNRTAADIRSTLSKYGVNLGESNSVSFQFERLGQICYHTSITSADLMFEVALEAGATDVVSTTQGHEIYCEAGDLATVRDYLMTKFGDPLSARLMWRPKNTLALDLENARTLFKMLDILEDNDDVQNIYANYDITEEIMKLLETS
jgi:YebC/PmpR family DNA-binding regulatory protein